jgi:translation initiation factor IF-2
VIGVVSGMEQNHKEVNEVKAGEEVCIKIEGSGSNSYTYGRHFDSTNQFYSKVSPNAHI